jgi:hypothetical protein
LPHRILRDRALRQPDARQFLDDGRRWRRHSMDIVQNVRQPFDTRAYPVGCSASLIGGDIGMLPAYFPPALRAFTNSHLIAPNLRLRRRGNIGDGDDLWPGLAQRAPAAGAIIRRHDYRDCLARRPFRRGSEAEGSLAGFPSRRLRMDLRVPFENGAAEPLRFNSSISARSCSITRL